MSFPARFPFTCSTCGKSGARGEQINWSRRHRGKVYHATCTPPDYSQPYNTPGTPDPTPLPEPQHEGQGSQGSQGDSDDEPQGQGEGQDQEQESESDYDNGKERSKQRDDTFDSQMAEKVKPYLPFITEPEGRFIAREEIDPIKAQVTKLHAMVRDGSGGSKPCPGVHVTRVEIIRKDMPEIKVDSAHVALAKALKLAVNGFHLYLYGPPGSGKSHLAKQIADILQRRYGYISGSKLTPESRILGFLDAMRNVQGAPFKECFTEGGVMCFDELDNFNASFLTTINGALENGHMAFPDKVYQRHPEFLVIGTGNTSGAGRSPQFPEREPFDAAFADRFAYVYVGYDEALERSLALGRNPEAKAWVDWVQALRGRRHGALAWSRRGPQA